MRCGADRKHGEIGICGAGDKLHIHHWMRHHGEEPPLSGMHGSGAIFFSGCPLRCVYCQNHRWSQTRPLPGKTYTVGELAALCLSFQETGCHNINFVTPEPWIPFIIPAVKLAKANGLRIPLVWNTSGFISLDGFDLIRDIVDIFLTDIRYKDSDEAHRLSGHGRYYDSCRTSALHMLESVGHFQMDCSGIGMRGIITRVLIIPGMVHSSCASLDFIARALSPDTYISLMAQYEPVHRIRLDHRYGRRVSLKELNAVRRYADTLGLHYGWRQDLDPPASEFLGTRMEDL